MKRLTSISLILLIIGHYALAIDKKVFEKYFKLLPRPKKIELQEGKGISYNSLQAIFLKGTDKLVLYGQLKSLAHAKKEGNGVLALHISNDKMLPDSDEGYIIDIKSNSVIIRARGKEGLFYGSQTLLQLLEDAKDQNIEIPACRITDYPDLAYRAVHLDLKHHMEAGHYYYEIIDRLAAIKINAIIVEFEDKLRYKKASVIGAPNAISIEEFAAISRYAKERNIEISPLVQGLGHASFILKHEKYHALRDDSSSDWAFDPVNPETYDLQFSLYLDAIAATPYGKYLHVGGDEVGDLGKSDLAKKSGLTPIQLQMHWLQKVCDFAKAHNRIPIFWDDMVFKLAGLYQSTWDPEIPVDQVMKTWKDNAYKLDDNINLFPKECIYMRWNYDSAGLPGNLKAIEWYKSHDLRVMAATAAQTMWPMLPRKQSNHQAIKDFCKIAAEQKLDGILCTAWDDCSPHFETLWRGFYDFAFYSWNYQEQKDLHSIFRHRFYAPQLSASSYEFQDLLEQGLDFWETALIEKGHRNNYPEHIYLIELPDHNKNGDWSRKYKAKLDAASGAVKRYRIIKERIEKSMQLSRRNQYALSIMSSINELQIYPSNLLLLLHKYDIATPIPARESALTDIKKHVTDFIELRKKIEDVYSTTRIINNPPDYLLDQNVHHHLANGTVNNDWMFVYELAMNEKLKKWFASNLQ